MKIGIIGAGHAGLEAANAAAAAGAEVTLFSAETALPYFRPRLVALAFGQTSPEAIQIHPPDWYAARHLELCLGQPVSALDPSRLTVTAGGQSRSFDGLVIAAGAEPVLPPFAAAAPDAILPIWSLAHALAIRQRVKAGGRLVVVGGGILGIEAALRALDAGMQVELVELLDRLMPAQFGARASTVLRHRLVELGIGVTLGRRVIAARPIANQGVRLGLDDGRELAADLCVLAIGAQPVGQPVATGLKADRGLVVDEFLRTSAPNCFAAGDIVRFNGLTRCSVREANSQGRLAGANVVAALRGEPLQAYRPESLPLTFKAHDFELYAIGQPGDDGAEEHLLQGMTERVIRSLIVKDGIPVGVQMIGTNEDFTTYADLVKRGQPALPPPDRPCTCDACRAGKPPAAAEI
jgi:NAD(P)H-nitrite reductase large subunit